jgi:acetoacetyl-CoA reductase
MVKTAIVTGGTRGIGRAVSIALAREGYQVAATYGGDDVAARAFGNLTGIGTYKFDVSDFDAAADAVAKIEAELGPTDVLVNNAGIIWDVPVHRMSMEQWSTVVRTDLDSVFIMSRHVVPGMRERRYGRIVNMTSINGQKGQFGQANYAAAKAGIIGFTKALALEGAGRGITVNCIAPGHIDTGMLHSLDRSVIEEKLLPLIPVGRLGTPEEIARCVTFLVSEEAGFLTGITLTANGGQYIA